MKYGFTVILAILMWDTAVLAQFPFSISASAAQQMIEKSCGSGLVLLSGEYQVADSTGQKFTFDGQTCVGRKTSFGVLVNGGIITRTDVLRPWNGDKAEYDTVAYKPVLSKVKALHLDSLAWTDIPCLEVDECLSVSSDSNWCYSAGVMDVAEGFVPDTTVSGTVDGWIVLLTGTEKKDSLAMISYRHSVEFKKGVNTYECPDKSKNTKIYGGVYLHPCYDGVGRITFALSGIILTGDSDWKILKTDTNVWKNHILHPEHEGNAPQLVPVGGRKPSSGEEGSEGTRQRKRKSDK